MTTDKSVRCKKCGRKFFKGEFLAIEIKCPKCGYIQKITGNLKKIVDILYQTGYLPQYVERFDRQA